MERVIWHDVECGSYAADLPLWRELAAAEAPAGPVLDLGAGTGRVALDLARRGVEVHAVDVDEALLAALRERARGLPVHTHAADVRDLRLDVHVALALAPMQTVQLLGGRAGRARMLAAVRRHLVPGGLLACAVAEEIDTFEPGAFAPLPDMREIDGIVYASRPVAIRAEDDAHVIERIRERVDRDGTHHCGEDRVRLDRLTAAALEAEAAACGYRPEPRRSIAETDDHVGSEVVMLRA
jgi:SAM-dependent methyltransferase